MATKKEEKTLTLNFADANLWDDSVRLFRDYADRSFLVGYYRWEKRKWILSHKLYNIRPESAHRRGGVDEKDPLSYAVDYAILFENRHQYRIFKVEKYEHLSLEEMRQLDYPNPHSDYMVFSLGEEVKFEPINLKLLLDQETGDEMGKPIYLTGRIIMGYYKKQNNKKDAQNNKDAIRNNQNGCKKNVTAKPFVKWAGGKSNLLPQLESLLPAMFNTQQEVTYIEPFVGGGAMLFYMLQTHKNIRRAVINDINPDLIRCYELIANSPRRLIELLKEIEERFYSVDGSERRDVYYNYRAIYNYENIHPDEKAALFVFLNHTCYNGLYRVNTKGYYNVPFGRYKNPVICNEELIMADHDLLNSVDLVIRHPGDYKLVRQNLSRNSINFIYFDPPYRPLSDTSYFKEYSASPFGDEQQVELKLFCDKLSELGCQIMVSNSDSKDENGESYFGKLYKGYSIDYVLASRFINADPENRSKLNEIVIRNY